VKLASPSHEGALAAGPSRSLVVRHQSSPALVCASAGTGWPPGGPTARPSLREGFPACPGACKRQGARQAQNSPQGLFRVRARCIGLGVAHSPPAGHPAPAQAASSVSSQATTLAQRRERAGRRGHEEASAEQRSAAGSGRLRPKSACLRSCTQGRVCGLALRSEQRGAPPTQSGARLQPSAAWPLSPLPLQRSARTAMDH
jgi:hypothetical protein